MNRPGRRAPSLALAALTAALTGACSSDPHQGYSFKGAHSEDIHSVSVPVFSNKTYASGLEMELTEAVIKEIQRTTGWTVTSSGAADATLKGTVLASDYKRLSVDPVTGLDQEVGVDVRVDFELRDNRTGKVVAERRNFGAMNTFVATRNSGERPQIGRTATVGTLARDIVAELRDSW